MRTGISLSVTDGDRERLQSIIADRNSSQKHVWRARIVLLTTEGCGTTEIMQQAGVAKTAVWRWQERFMREGVDGLLRDKTRPSRIPPEVAERVVALTLGPPSGEVTHWTAAAMARAAGISVSSMWHECCGAAHPESGTTRGRIAASTMMRCVRRWS